MQFDSFSKRMTLITGPIVVTRVVRHSGTHRVQFDVTHAVHKIVSLLNQCGFEPTFKSND